MQAENRWTAPEGPLGRLSQRALERAEGVAHRMAEFRVRAADLSAVPSLARALRGGPSVALIAELKRQSPSKGVINAGLAATERPRLYADAGARALSILTEPTEFGGSLDDLLVARRSVAVPLIRKDFNVHPVQVWEGRVAGASAVLLIARALAPGALERMVDACGEAGVEPFIEVRSEDDLARAVATGAPVIGVNARDLETLAIDPAVTARLLPQIPSDRVRVAESGVATVDDVERAAALAADAVLVGSSLSAAGSDAEAAALARALAGVARRRAS